MTHTFDDACLLRYTPAASRPPASHSGAKERAVEREKNSRALLQPVRSRCDDDCSANRHINPLPEECSGAASPPSHVRMGIILRLPSPTLARAAELVQRCSAMQGGGACVVFAVQADGQVLQFSAACVTQLPPLRKSECSCRGAA